MYRPESGIAEEFINDQEIKDTLAYADANKDNKELILSIIEKAKKLKGIPTEKLPYFLHVKIKN